MAPAAFRHALRIYWEDTDAGGIVFHANYLKYFERARTEWLRASGWGQQQMRDEHAAIFVVTDTSVHFRRPAVLDDRLEVSCAATRFGSASLDLAQQAWRGDELLVDASVRIACVDAGTFKPRRIPNDILERLR
jgi:acyl-CoA thioester hydrolase